MGPSLLSHSPLNIFSPLTQDPFPWPKCSPARKRPSFIIDERLRSCLSTQPSYIPHLQKHSVLHFKAQGGKVVCQPGEQGWGGLLFQVSSKEHTSRAGQKGAGCRGANQRWATSTGLSLACSGVRTALQSTGKASCLQPRDYHLQA